ncbi:MAG: hypothetical protein RLP15_05215 [Cryomorphaceae bacterium]
MDYRLTRTLFALLFIGWMGNTSIAQRGGNTSWKKFQHEVAVGAGVNSVFANLGERDGLGVAYIMQRSTFNGTYRYYFMKHFAARGSISHGYSRKNDKSLKYSDRQNVRLDYISTVTEFAAMGEYHLIDETTKGRKGKVRRSRGGMTKGVNMGLSAFAGVGMSYMRPFGELQGRKMEFKPITTPLTVPNDDRYKRIHLHIPVGINARLLINEHWRAGIEVGYRLGFRDYVDNVSGVYAVGDFKNADPFSPDEKYFGFITFAKEEAPIADLSSDSGRRSYIFGFLTLAYRLKT